MQYRNMRKNTKLFVYKHLLHLIQSMQRQGKFKSHDSKEFLRHISIVRYLWTIDQGLSFDRGGKGIHILLLFIYDLMIGDKMEDRIKEFRLLIIPRWRIVCILENKFFGFFLFNMVQIFHLWTHILDKLILKCRTSNLLK
jgi:hypothetical protein